MTVIPFNCKITQNILIIQSVFQFAMKYTISNRKMCIRDRAYSALKRMGEILYGILLSLIPEKSANSAVVPRQGNFGG